MWIVIDGFHIGRKAKLVHHPISFGAFPSTSTVIDQGLLEANAFMGFFHTVYGLVNPCGFPESRLCHPVRPYAVPVLSSSSAEEVPFFVPQRIHFFMHYQKITTLRGLSYETMKLYLTTITATSVMLSNHTSYLYSNH